MYSFKKAGKAIFHNAEHRISDSILCSMKLTCTLCIHLWPKEKLTLCVNMTENHNSLKT